MNSNHVALKITLHLENKFCKLSDMPFDGVLAKLYFQEKINAKAFFGDFSEQLPFLKMSDGIYHASRPIYKINHIFNETINKSFDVSMFIEMDGHRKYNKSFQNIRSGVYKKHLVTYELLHTDSIIYYANGDFTVIAQLLSNLNHIGKKVSLGWGKVHKIEIEEISEDFSILKNGLPMRHLPDIEKYRFKDMTKTLMPLVHPYWKYNNDIALVYTGPLT